MNVKMNVLYARDYRERDGAPLQTHWIQCGVAWMTERGIDVKLWVVPPATVDALGNMVVQVKLREPRQKEARAGGESESESAPPTRAYEKQGPEVSRRRPEHRDQLDPQAQLRGVPNGRSEPQR